MADANIERAGHYRAYKPRSFTREERDRTTILFGGLTWRHEALLEAIFGNLGYKARPLPNISRKDLDAGKELIDTGSCCPTTFTTGNLINFLKSESSRIGKEETMRRYVFLTVGNCGACRFGQYHTSYEMGLRNMGFEDFRMFLMAQDGLDQGLMGGGGLEITMPFTLGAIWAVLLGDIVTDLEYRIRPYEVSPGETDRTVRESIDRLYEVLRTRPIKGKRWGSLAWHLATGYFTGALREIMAKFEAIEVDWLRVKPKVAITGEFWLQTHEGEGNYNMKKWLEEEGAEVIPPSIAVWLDYMMKSRLDRLKVRIGLDPRVRLKMARLRVLRAIYRWNYNRLRRSVGRIPYGLPCLDDLQSLAAPYYHHHLSGGEGFMLVGKALYYHLYKKSHMVCELSPYSCLPNTMSIGSMAAVQGQYPDLLYAPIEIKGDAEVHALSRCQMILTEAKKRAISEFEYSLEETGLTVEQIRACESRHPELRRATCRIPHKGVAGTAANYVRHLAGLIDAPGRRKVFSDQGLQPEVTR
jgi:predicted nucleotide-binding protein (sugar kinase/HSP70/actin superfamily)